VHSAFAGSKRKAKIAARDERRVEAVKARLRKIYAYARLLKNEDELDAFLATILDPAVRAATKTMIEPFCLFRCRRHVEIASPTDVMDAVLAADASATHVVLS
jgi:hypothetical protein